MALFAPVLESSQPAFVSTNSYNIKFSLSSFNTWDEFSEVDIKINQQTNDSSIVNNNLYKDYIIKKDKTNISSASTNSAYITITSEDINGWTSGVLYKVQMRLRDNTTVSEWSNIMIIKPITQPILTIHQSNLNTNLTPLFQASTKFGDNEKEVVDKYRFSLYDDAGDLIEQSDWLLHGVSSSVDTYRFKNALEDTKEYSLKYEIISNNKYEDSTSISFMVQIIYLQETLVFDGTVKPDNENACIELVARTPEEKLWTGNYLIIRSSEKTNYTIWEELKYFQLNAKNELTYRDYTVENGVKYKYALQRENLYGRRTNYTVFSDIGTSVEFEHSYLVSNEKQLKLAYNVELSSFKRTKLESKSDTIGSKYPTILKNGYADYAEFPITGLISYHMDEDALTFLDKKDDGLYYKDNLIMPLVDGEESSIDFNLTSDNIKVERAFREAVLDFLQNEPYKLFKSPTEGNLLISMINVSLTPENTLGRMLYKFSATAYEVKDTSLETLNGLNIINKGSYSNVLKDGAYLKGIGQLSGYFSKNTNLYGLIKAQIENVVSKDSYSQQLNKIISIKIEAFPRISNNQFEGYCRKNNLDIDSTVKPFVDDKIFNIILNGQTIYIKSGLSYCVKDNLENLTLLNGLENCWLLIDYVYDYTKIENKKMTIKNQKLQTCYGQLNGLFTKRKIRDRILSISDNKKIETEKISYSLDIWKEIQYQVLNKYFSNKNNSYKWDEKERYWVNENNNKCISFSTNKGANIKQLDIEANSGTAFLLSDSKITIGNSEKYSLKPKEKSNYTLDDFMTTLAFEKDCFAVVNYCLNVVVSEREDVDLN